MKKATSIVQGSLRLVSLVITIVTIATLATIGYSAYQEYNVLVSPQSSQNLKLQASVVNGALHLTVAGAVPNNGLYPLNFSIVLAAKSHSSVLAQSISQPVRILPNQVKRFNISLGVNPYNVKNSMEQSTLLINGSQITLSTGIRASIEPFVSLKVAGGSNLTLPPLMGDLRVGPVAVSRASNGTALIIPISFIDKSAFSFPFSVRATLKDSQGSNLGTSTSLTGVAVSGNQTAFKLTIALSGQRSLTGTYPLELDVTIGGTTIPVQAKVEVSG